MTEIIPASLQQYQATERIEEASSDELGQDEFLTLMLTQLKHQDPFQPMENGEFIGQLAQFSTVSGIEQMQVALEDLSGSFVSNQTLEATRLVGKEVLIESDTVFLDENNEINGRFQLDAASGDVQLTVLDQAGAAVNQISLGEYPAGRHDFTWNGMDKNNNRLPAGAYSVQVTSRIGDTYGAAATLVGRQVESVEFSNAGSAAINTSNGEVMSLSDVRAVRENSLTE